VATDQCLLLNGNVTTHDRMAIQLSAPQARSFPTTDPGWSNLRLRLPQIDVTHLTYLRKQKQLNCDDQLSADAVTTLPLYEVFATVFSLDTG